MMGGLGVQDLAVGAIVLAALGWLVVRRLRRRSAACEDCPGCAIGTKGVAITPARPAGEGGTLIPPSELTRKR